LGWERTGEGWGWEKGRVKGMGWAKKKKHVLFLSRTNSPQTYAMQDIMDSNALQNSE